MVVRSKFEIVNNGCYIIHVTMSINGELFGYHLFANSHKCISEGLKFIKEGVISGEIFTVVPYGKLEYYCEYCTLWRVL